MRLTTLLPACLLAFTPFALCAAETLTADELDAVMEFRRWVHANPELGNHEFETAKRIATHLREMGLDVKTGIAVTGIVGVLDTGRPGPIVAVRADMDALPVTENSGLPFASTKTTEYQGQQVGVAHACGHDIHMSVGLGTAQALVNRKDSLRGKVMFIFQPAEEGVPPGEKGGAQLMLEEGVFDALTPDAIFALHSFPDLEVGNIGYSVGPAFAATDHFILSVSGEQTHGAYPHLGTDSIVMASEIVGALQTIDARTINPRDPVVVSVGMIHGGERFNIIPNALNCRARCEATTRRCRTRSRRASGPLRTASRVRMAVATNWSTRKTRPRSSTIRRFRNGRVRHCARRLRISTCANWKRPWAARISRTSRTSCRVSTSGLARWIPSTARAGCTRRRFAATAQQFLWASKR